MAKESVKSGTTSHSINVFVYDSSSTTGAGLSGLAYNTSNLVAYYSFAGANATSVAISLATLAAVNSAWSSGGFKEIDATNMKGWYRVDVPNAVITTGKGQTVTLLLSGATNMAPCVVEIELTGWDNQSTTDGGLSKLTSLTFTVSNKIDANVYTWNGTAVTTPNTAGTPIVDIGRIRGTTAVGAAGYMGIDWSAINAPTTTVNLSGTKINDIGIAGTYSIWNQDYGSTVFDASTLGELAQGNLPNLNATISSRAAASTALSTAQWTNARAGYLDNLSAGAVALAASVSSGFSAIPANVWARDLSSPQTSGTAADYLRDAGLATDTQLDAAGVRAAIGMAAADLDTQLDAIASDVIAGLSAIEVTVISPTNPDSAEINLTQGDDYLLTNGRQIPFTFNSSPSLSGATATLKMARAGTTTSATITFTSSTAGYAERTAAQTGAMLAGEYLYEVEVTLADGHIMTTHRGPLFVTADI